MEPISLEKRIQDPAFGEKLTHLYGQEGAGDARARCAAVIAGFTKTFESLPEALFSAPGRTELGGNHTDHQHGHVLAAGVDLDILAAAAPNQSGMIRVQSQGYPLIVVDLHELAPKPEEENTSAALIRGVAARLSELGYQNSSGNSFSFSTIRGILSNPKYKGWYCGGKTSKVDYKLKAVKQFAPEEWLTYRDEEAVPAIVPEELWDRANDILARRSAKQSARDKSSYQNKYPYSGKILCGVHHVPYYRSLYRFKTCEKEVWRCREYVKSGKSGCTGPTLYTEELDSIMRQCLEEVLPDRTGFIREMVQLYSGAGPSARLEGELAQKRKSADALLKRKDKLLDLNVSGCISDGEFTLRNRRFNEELESLEAEVKALEAEKRRCRDTAQSAETLGQAIAEELSFPGGFSQLVLDALLDHLDVVGEADGRIRVSVWLKGRTEGEAFTIHRRRGCPSVCSRAYI